jgi:hypothetical protein
MDPIEKIYEAQIAIQALQLELNVAQHIINKYGATYFLANHELLNSIRSETQKISSVVQVLTNANEQ